MDNKVLAKVNGKEITQEDLNNAMVRFPKENQQYFATEQGKSQLLDQMVSFELIHNYAKEQGLENSDEYKEQLEVLKRDILIQAAVKKILDSVTVTEEEIKEFYNNNEDMFMTQESVSAKHILVDSEEKAKDIKAKIEAGTSFEDAAKEYSSCPSAAQGGDLGNFTRGRMVPEFEEASFALEIGKVSDPVKTQFGYHLIKVEEKMPAAKKSFDEVKNSIKVNLLSQKQNNHYIEFVNNLKNDQKVEIL